MTDLEEPARPAARIRARRATGTSSIRPRTSRWRCRWKPRELLEVFQWLTEEQSRAARRPKAQAAARARRSPTFCSTSSASRDKLGIDPVAAAQRKLVANAQKYPVDKARGNRKKYTEL